jgi:tetratricopeptide (TPR) repeat protein
VTAPALRAIFEKAYWYPLPDYTVYRPLVKLSWLFEYAVLGEGDHALGYHIGNFAWHALNALLLWQLALAAGLRRAPAFFAASLFAVHPITTEAVANIAGRPDLMAAAFVLGGVLLHAKAGAPSGIAARLGLGVLAVAGAASKESAVVLLPVMIVWDLAFRGLSRRHWRPFVAAYAAAGSGSLAALLLRHWVLRRLHAPLAPYVDNPLLGLGFWQARLAACAVILRYLKLLAWPSTLSCDYSYNQIPVPPLWAGAAASTAVGLLLAAALLAFRRSRAVFFFALLFFLALFPVSNIAILVGSIMAERFLYLPAAGFAAFVSIAITAAVTAMAAKFAAGGNGLRPAAAALSLLTVALGVRTYQRNFDWSSDLALWTAAVKASPNSFKAHWLHGNWLVRGGDVSRVVEAIEEEQTAVRILSPLPPERSLNVPYATLGQLWTFRGDSLRERDPDGAAEAYRAAVRAFRAGIPSDRAHNLLEHQADIARGWAPAALPDDGNPPLYMGLAQVLEQLGRFPEALDAVLYCIRVTPADPSLYSAASRLYEELGNNREALQYAAQSALLGKGAARFDRFEPQFNKAVPGDCAPVDHGTPESFRLDCPAVKAVVCDAERALLAAFRETRHFEQIGPYRASSLTRAVCEAAR